MTGTLVKARKIGGSLMVTLPREVVEKEDIREGQLLELEVHKARKSFFGIDPGVAPHVKEKFSDFD